MMHMQQQQQHQAAQQKLQMQIQLMQQQQQQHFQLMLHQQQQQQQQPPQQTSGDSSLTSSDSPLADEADEEKHPSTTAEEDIVKEPLAMSKQPVTPPLAKPPVLQPSAEILEAMVALLVQRELKKKKFTTPEVKVVKLLTVGYRHIGFDWQWSSGDRDGDAVAKRLRDNFDMAEEIDIVVDSTNFVNGYPHARSVNSHTGEHEQIIWNIVEDGMFGGFIGAFETQFRLAAARKPNAEKVVLVFCPWGKHRSIATARILKEILMTDGFDVKEPVHVSGGLHRNICGGACKHCNIELKTYSKMQAFKEAIAIWKSID